jgi:hypothetical protein
VCLGLRMLHGQPQFDLFQETSEAADVRMRVPCSSGDYMTHRVPRQTSCDAVTRGSGTGLQHSDKVIFVTLRYRLH